MKKLLFTLFMQLSAASLLAGILVVDAKGYGDYLTVADGISNSLSGDTIYIVSSSGTYGNVTLSTPRTIIGNGYFGQSSGHMPASTIGTLTLSPGSAGSVIAHLEMGALTISDNNLTIRSCLIAGAISTSVAVTGISIDQSLITSSFTNTAATVSFSNTIFSSTLGSFTVSVTGSGSAQFSYCTFFDGNHNLVTATASNCVLNTTRVTQSNAIVVDGVSGNVEDTEVNLDFETALANDLFYQLGAGSTALNSSTEGTASGAFGSPSAQPELAYVPSGIPSIPQVKLIYSEPSSNNVSNLSIRIQADN
jgi:hypothetical protein